jgi:hypothetical protein
MDFHHLDSKAVGLWSTIKLGTINFANIIRWYTESSERFVGRMSYLLESLTGWNKHYPVDINPLHNHSIYEVGQMT